MARQRPTEDTFPVKLSPAQRRALFAVLTGLAARLKADEKGPQAIPFTLDELTVMREMAAVAAGTASGAARRSLQTVLAAVRKREAEALASVRIYQFKIALVETEPPIWRRIHVEDGSLDKLHEHIQTAMGWTNSHLHDFKINDVPYGDPVLMDENFTMFDYRDSLTTKMSEVLPADGSPFRFTYQYDFGDSWQHEVLFEGIVPARPGVRYPVCVEGERACPPEDVGGAGSYAIFLQAIKSRRHPRHREFLDWVGGSFDPVAFDPAEATSRMHEGIFDWRNA